MRSTYLLAAILFATPALGQAPIDPKVQARIDRILKATPLIDGHNDIAEQLVENYGSRVERLDQGTAQWTPKPLMTDMARLPPICRPPSIPIIDATRPALWMRTMSSAVRASSRSRG